MEGNQEEAAAVANVVGDIHKCSGELLWWLKVDYEVPVNINYSRCRISRTRCQPW